MIMNSELGVYVPKKMLWHNLLNFCVLWFQPQNLVIHQPYIGLSANFHWGTLGKCVEIRLKTGKNWWKFLFYTDLPFLGAPFWLVLVYLTKKLTGIIKWYDTLAVSYISVVKTTTTKKTLLDIICGFYCYF